jgi:uncharacterized protein (DUF58 family)
VKGKLGAPFAGGTRRSLARLNHILIPEKKPERDRLRKSLAGRVFSPAFAAYASLSRDGRALALITLTVGFVGLDVRQSQVHLLFAMLAALLATSLVARFFFRAPELRVAVETTARVSVGDAQRFIVHLDNPGPRRLLGLRVFPPFLPWDGAWTSQTAGVAALEPRARATVFAEATFIARGEHHLDAFEVAPLVPLGLALGRGRESDGVRFLVVPRIVEVAPLALVHRRPRRPAGAVVSQAAGESDIAGVRPYRSGDPIRHLHARTWARTGTPHVRQYVAERSDRVALLVWVDGAAATEDAREAAIEVAAGAAAFLALRSGGLDLLVVDGEALPVAPRSGRNALDLVLDRLAVHALTSEEALPDAALDAHESGLSTLILVTADEEPRRRALVSSLVRRGLPIQWLSVVQGEPRGPGPAHDRAAAIAGAPITRIPMASLARGRGAAAGVPS